KPTAVETLSPTSTTKRALVHGTELTIWPTVSIARGRESALSQPSGSGTLHAVVNPVPREIVRIRPYLLLVDAREPPPVLLDVGAAVLAHLEVEGRVDDEPEARRSRTPRLVDDEARQQGGARAASDAHCPGSEANLDAGDRESVKGLCVSVGEDNQRLVL